MPIEFPNVHAMPNGLWRWPHVNLTHEWACQGTGKILIVPEFLDLFEELRARMGVPLHITSGYRSPEHNLRVATTGPEGPHTTGQAVDIAIQGFAWVQLVAAAVDLGYTGFGIKQTGAQAGRFIHLDTLTNKPGRPRPAQWFY
jgi:uncharacterized protein YcbK (DUF882 family)